eukprot:1113971-Rhodomonas_salina.2
MPSPKTVGEERLGRHLLSECAQFSGPGGEDFRQNPSSLHVQKPATRCHANTAHRFRGNKKIAWHVLVLRSWQGMVVPCSRRSARRAGFALD